MKNKIKIGIISIIGIILLIFILKIAINTSRRDAAYIKEITNPEHIEKAGESVGKASRDLKIRKDAFMKGYNKTKKDSTDENR